MIGQKEKCEIFADLHRRSHAFVIPNPWDVGSAKILEGLGFEAIATTSAGLAVTLGKADGHVTLEEKLAHCEQIARATNVPLNVDFENGYADDPEGVARNVLRVAATGAAGCSVEDCRRVPHEVYDFAASVERVQAAAEAVATLGIPFQLTARAENLLRGIDDLDDTIQRLKAYEAAGADVSYAPGLTSLEQLRQVSAELDKPVNVLAVFFSGVTVAELAEAGARRISVGSGLHLAALAPLLAAGKEMLEDGTFEWTRTMASGAALAKLMR